MWSISFVCLTLLTEMLEELKLVIQLKLLSNIKFSWFQKQKITPSQSADFWVTAGLDRTGFAVKFISDFKG